MKVLLFLWLASLVCCETTEDHSDQTSDSAGTPTPEYDYTATYDYDDYVTSAKEQEHSATMGPEGPLTETTEDHSDQTSDSAVTPTPQYDYDYNATYDYYYVTAAKEQEQSATMGPEGPLTETTEDHSDQTSDSAVTPTPQYDYDYNATYDYYYVTAAKEQEQSATMGPEETTEAHRDQTSDHSEDSAVTQSKFDHGYTVLFKRHFKVGQEQSATMRPEEARTVQKRMKDPQRVSNSCRPITHHRSIIGTLLMSLPALLYERGMTFVHSI
ncbi:uncharacterized protein LOC101162953 isoform X1 [Oryzias latipes]|uniref:uncharacterized protein LOC101162953 isoform X1 n=1 Tax=Oryzias latipes TaxID=8090 RepID=UPI0002A49EC0|nr:uncharacterized protein LOC101162953 isoform X1 [Oryzias latipes]